MRSVSPEIDPSKTTGSWQTEAEPAHAFDQLVESLGGLFRVYKEVPGRFQHFRPSQDLQTARIDRILVPTDKLKESGWTLGPVGVEIKASGTKLGPPLCQLIDYSHASWNLLGTWMVPEWYFLWPAHKFYGPLQSILAGQRCGGVHRDPYGQLIFHSSSILAKLNPDYVDVRPGNANHGAKRGSR